MDLGCFFEKNLFIYLKSQNFQLTKFAKNLKISAILSAENFGLPKLCTNIFTVWKFLIKPVLFTWEKCNPAPLNTINTMSSVLTFKNHLEVRNFYQFLRPTLEN